MIFVGISLLNWKYEKLVSKATNDKITIHLFYRVWLLLYNSVSHINEGLRSLSTIEKAVEPLSLCSFVNYI